MTTKNTTSKQRHIGLGATLLVVLLIFVLTLTPPPANTQAAANVQPELLAIAAEQPDTAVRVIIQKAPLRPIWRKPSPVWAAASSMICISFKPSPPSCRPALFPN